VRHRRPTGSGWLDFTPVEPRKSRPQAEGISPIECATPVAPEVHEAGAQEWHGFDDVPGRMGVRQFRLGAERSRPVSAALTPQCPEKSSRARCPESITRGAGYRLDCLPARNAGVGAPPVAVPGGRAVPSALTELIQRSGSILGMRRLPCFR
jgi:hypothetical protein